MAKGILFFLPDMHKIHQKLNLKPLKLKGQFNTHEKSNQLFTKNESVYNNPYTTHTQVVQLGDMTPN